MSLTNEQNVIIDQSLEQFHAAMITAGDNAWRQIEPIILSIPTQAVSGNKKNTLYTSDESGQAVSYINNIMSNEYVNTNTETSIEGMHQALVDIAEITKEHYNNMGITLLKDEGPYTYETMVKGLITNVGVTDFNKYFGVANFNVEVMEYTTNHLYTHISKKDSMQVTMTSMESIVKERFYTFSVTSSLTLMSIFVRRLNDIYATYGSKGRLDWVKYSGPNDNLTRDFCHDRLQLKGHYHKFEVADFPKNYGDWDGMVKNTDKFSIFLFLGGYNCRHALEYVTEDMVSQEDKDRVSAEYGIIF